MATLTPSLRQIAITSQPEAEEAVSALLANLFATTPSTTIMRGSSEIVTSVFQPTDDQSAAHLKKRIRTHLEQLEALGVTVGETSIRVRKIRAQDWSESWKRHFRPIEVSPRLLVLPPWSRRKAKRDQATVVLDPGLSFGTGNHPTTLFCLEQIARVAENTAVPSLLDVGTGSGILAIAAAKLGYNPISAFDNDLDAVQSAQANAERNGVAEQMTLFESNVAKLSLRPKARFNVVCANLTHDLLKQHARRINGQVSPEGTLCLAGILIEQFDAVVACFGELGWHLESDATQNEWRSAALRKKP